MKCRLITMISLVLVFAPWTILPLRTFDWALESPTAEIMITGYAGGMILGGIFTVAGYVKARVRNGVMKVCLVLNGMYMIGGIAALSMIYLTP